MKLIKYLLPFALVFLPISARAQFTTDFTNVNILTGGTLNINSGATLTLPAGSAMTVNLTGYGNNKLLGLTSAGGAVGVIGLGAGMSISGGNLVAAASTSANPSATIGLSAVNGAAGTFMTSDSAPPLSQAITPTWTNLHTFSPTAVATTSIKEYGINVSPTLNQRNGALYSMIFGNETITQAGSGTQDLEELQIATVDKWVIDSTGTVKTGAWNGSVIGTSYGGAGAINGVLSANGSGVVSAALAGTGVSIASQTISLASITSGFVVGNNTGSGASPQGVSLSSMFDTLGNTQGQIMYRSASSWIPLSTGTVHQVLESGGASANIDWTSTPTFQSFTSTGTATNSITNTTAGSNEMLDILSTNGPDSAQTYIYLGQSKATQKSVIFDFYQGTTGNSYNDSSLAIGFFGETPTADFNLLKGGNLTLGSGTGGGLTVNGDISAAAPQITKATGTGITVNQAGDVRHLVYKTTVTFAGLSAAAHTADLTIATLPAKSKITAFYADVTTGFTGGGETADTISAGIAAGGTTILAAGSAFTTHTWGLADADMGTSMTRAAAIQGGYIPNWTGTQIISVRLSTTTNNTSTLNAGSVTFYIVTDVFP